MLGYIFQTDFHTKPQPLFKLSAQRKLNAGIKKSLGLIGREGRGGEVRRLDVKHARQSQKKSVLEILQTPLLCQKALRNFDGIEEKLLDKALKISEVQTMTSH